MTTDDKVKIERLQDKSRLQEIFELRVDAWESSKSSNIINHQKYPEGFTDEFDYESIHLIATDRNDQIMSACRVTFFETNKNFPYINLTDTIGFPTNNFALIGRGVRRKDFYHKRLQYEFVNLGLDICRQHNITQATGHAYNENVYMQQLMLDLGFRFLCDVDPNNYNNKNIAYNGRLYIVDLSTSKKSGR